MRGQAASANKLRAAFTIVELMVSMAILTAIIAAVAAIFSIGSEAAGRTESHAEILEASAAFQQSVSDDLAHMAGGLLIIESPPPTLVRAEVSGGPQLFRLRHDRLVFIASRGSEGDYQSFTDPTRGDPITDPTKAPAGSPEALVYYGPGIPVSGNGTATGVRKPFDDESIGLPASEWVFARRAILLMGAALPVAGWSPPDMADFDAGLLTSAPEIFEARMDALVSSGAESATSATLVNKIAGLTLTLDSPPLLLSDLWAPNLTPVTTNLTNSTYADYYARSGFNFQPRLADFRIEWTDGRRVDPNNNDNSTRWFGLAPDRNELPDLTAINSMKFQARMRRFAVAGNPSNPNPANPDNPASEIAPFNTIEWSLTDITPDSMARYRAVWRTDTWAYKPKALRFTYRIYDATQRLKQNTTVDFNEDGLPDLASSGKPYVTTRWGQEFSIVVPIP